jgi:hypothetical protein
MDPQFRFSTPEGDYHLAVTLPADDYERRSMLRRVSAFMAWKQALGFTLASELIQPDAVDCLGVTAKEVRACLSRVRRQPRSWTKDSFGPLEWIERAQIGQEMIDLLPLRPRAMTPRSSWANFKEADGIGERPSTRRAAGRLMITVDSASGLDATGSRIAFVD